MKKNPLQFAITREDPELELRVLKDLPATSHVLLICSAGDTALALKKAKPQLQITAFDFNPHQLQHLLEKASGKKTGEGNFESLFKLWRQFFNEFILSPEETKEMFLQSPNLRTEIYDHPYWEVSFNLHFHDSFLRAMFGDAAIQHAPKGSYPRYFQQAFEKGLKSESFQQNPYLQHIFFGDFLSKPTYLESPPALSGVELIQGTILDVPKLDQFDLIQLSNIFDWSSDEEIRETCELLRQMKKGSKLLVRQINNEAPFLDYLGEEFKLESDLSDELLKMDRSLFYSRVTLVTRT